ncbi:MAG: hypothetical protein MJZ67_04455 [Bacteroidales bacterium]|nr:hypothetical protein [Bacteroidales bacterium]
MKVTITKPDATLFEGEATQIHLPGIDGKFEMLQNHAPIISALGQGQIKLIQPDGNEVIYDIRGGVLRGQNNEIQILVQ